MIGRIFGIKYDGTASEREREREKILFAEKINLAISSLKTELKVE